MPDSGMHAVRLGPFQRAVLETSQSLREITVSNAEVSVDDLAAAVYQVLDVTPALRAELVDVPSMRTPWQRLAAVCEVRGADRWSVTAGDTVIEIVRRKSRTWMTLRVPSVFADHPSLSRFVEQVASALIGPERPPVAEPFAVESAHLEMLQEGALETEERHWRSRRSAVLATADEKLDLSQVLPAGSGAARAARRPLDEAVVAAMTAVAAAAGGRPADVAQLALIIVFERLGLGSERLTRVADARELMGLTRAVGVFSHVVPAPVVQPSEAAGSLRQALAALVRDREAEDELIGCPAPDAASPAAVLLAEAAVELPGAWRLEEISPPVPAGMTLEFVAGVTGAELRVTAKEAVDAGLLLEVWHTALAGLLADPDAPWPGAGLAGAADLISLADELTALDARPEADDVCDRLLKRARFSGDRVALRRGDAVWSCADLLRYVEELAGRLAAVRSGDVIAVVARSDQPALIVAQLAVLWRGAAFLPIDPEEPAARVRDTVERSGAVLVLSAEPLAMEPGVPVLQIAAGVETVPAASVVPVTVTGETVAYVMRTSGSTGRPKLVRISRRALANYLRWVEEMAEEVAGDRLLPALSPAVFDASLKQTLGMVYAGRPVWMPFADRRDPAALVAELADGNEAAGVVINCVPSYWSAFLDALPPGAAPSVGAVLLGGEAVTRSLLERTWAALPNLEVYNLYGPTETTATATMGGLRPGASIDVGRPVAGAVVIAVDRFGAPLPKGLVGELLIAGPGVSSGYLVNEMDETDATSSPFFILTVGGMSAPAYRTGDQGRVAGDGTVSVIGRRDGQVKVNGVRIELGEIESVAERLPDVQRAVAVVDGAALRLFVTGTAGPAEVRRHLSTLFPAALVPATVHSVPRLPTLSSDKVNRAALLAGVQQLEEADPRSYDDRQHEVAAVWRDLLSSGWPRLTDDFFASGGHSLLLAQLVNRLRSQGHPELSLRHVIRAPTVEAIAACMTTSRPAEPAIPGRSS